MAMIGPTSSRAPTKAASTGVFPSLRCRSMFSTTTMASSTTSPTERTMARRVRRLTVNPNTCIRKTPPISDNGNRHDRYQYRAQGAEEEEDDDHDDEQRVAERLEHFVDGVGDVVGGVVGDAGLESGRQVALDGIHLRPHPLDDVEGVRVRERPDPHEHRGLPGKVDLRVVILGAQHHIGDVAQADDGAVLLAHHQFLNSSTERRSVSAVRLTWMSEPLLRPRAARKLLAARAWRTWAGLMLSAAIRSGLSQMRMAKVRAPRISARCTPSMAESRGWTTRTR